MKRKLFRLIRCFLKLNHDLVGFDDEDATIRAKIQEYIGEHYEIIQELSTLTNKSDNGVRLGNAAVEAIAKLLTTKSDAKLRFNFQNQGTKIVKTIRAIETKIHSGDSVESATGEVMCFTENDQKVTLFKLKPLTGQLVLSVLKPVQREQLLDFQKENRVIGVKYSPTVDQLRHDKSTRGGVLNEITWIGRTPMELFE
jgi:hypothetical protein